ncbi:MAG: hypothetical protein OEW48_08145 [Phycisphaerae bacterium]|nr:hypothetical protein [Phycisphaerae bacterium]
MNSLIARRPGCFYYVSLLARITHNSKYEIYEISGVWVQVEGDF